MPLVNLTRATFLKAEFGFLGVLVYTRVHTPLLWGEPSKAGAFSFPLTSFLPILMSWFMVGNFLSFKANLPELYSYGLYFVTLIQQK